MNEKERIQSIIKPLIKWYQVNKKPLPWREGKSPYRVWISEIMLQQTRTSAVIPYFLRFMEKYPTLDSLAAAEDDELMKLWEGLGYYSRARNLKKCAIELMTKYDGAFPHDLKSLLSLPGIGPYTAGAISSIAFGEPCPAVDGNVLRVLMRVLASDRDIADERTKRAVTELLCSVYPSGEQAALFTEALMELGENVCIPNGEPRCDKCPICKQCFAYEGKIQSLFPVKSPKKPRRTENRTILVISNGDTFYIRKRAPKGLLASLYEFPNLEGHLSNESIAALLDGYGVTDYEVKPLSDATHIFTHVEWHMIGYRIVLSSCPSEALIDAYKLVGATREEIEAVYSIPTAYKSFTKSL